MSARLSPAQRRVVDAMRDGAVLKHEDHRCWLDNGESEEDVEEFIVMSLYWAHALNMSHHAGADEGRVIAVYVLAAAYQGGEA